MLDLARVRSSPKGNQNKWVSPDGKFYYKQDKFSGDAVAEYLCSLILESSDNVVPFVPYRLDTPAICKSLNYKPPYEYLSFAYLLGLVLREEPWYERVVVQKGSVFNYWYKNVWGKLSSQGRVNFVVTLFEKYGVPREDSLRYLTVMVELDTLVLNVDRHFNNFGIMYDTSIKRHVPALLFDQGMSLGVGADYFGTLKDITDLRKIKMQPFSTRVSTNRSALLPYRLGFSIEKFVTLLRQTNPFGDVFIKSSVQFGVLKRRLGTYYGTDVNGLNILEYLSSEGL